MLTLTASIPETVKLMAAAVNFQPPNIGGGAELDERKSNLFFFLTDRE